MKKCVLLNIKKKKKFNSDENNSILINSIPSVSYLTQIINKIHNCKQKPTNFSQFHLHSVAFSVITKLRRLKSRHQHHNWLTECHGCFVVLCTTVIRTAMNVIFFSLGLAPIEHHNYLRFNLGDGFNTELENIDLINESQ